MVARVDVIHQVVCQPVSHVHGPVRVIGRAQQVVRHVAAVAVQDGE